MVNHTIPAILLNVSQELLELSHKLEEAESSISHLLDNQDHPTNAVNFRSLQNVDTIMQTLIALSSYLNEIGKLSNEYSTVNVSGAICMVPLADLAERLSHCGQDLNEKSISYALTNVELF